MDTIAAIATPSGKGGVAIIRISGPNAKSIGKAVSKNNHLMPRYASYSKFYDLMDRVLDEGIIIWFKAPNSFTGEDVVELQCHGGPVMVNMILADILQRDCRMARPGEFSERAFLNGRMDLTQAEAIADLINAGSQQAARAAIHSLQGDFSNAVNEIKQNLIQLRMYVESALDFPEEEIDFLADKKILTKLQELQNALSELFKQTKQGKLLQEGISVVIVGKPNAGKSSLLNRFTGQESAIVTEVAGTTRDTVKEYIQIDGVPLHIIDTAGIRNTTGVVEKIGIQRTFLEIEKADLVLALFDASKDKSLKSIEKTLAEWNISEKEVIFVKNKIDISGEKPGYFESDSKLIINISAKTAEGILELKQMIKEKIGMQNQMEGIFSARQRHIDALNKASVYLHKGEQQLSVSKAGELLAEDLRQTQKALDEITGEFTADDLLGEIFTNFCIGK